jgi:hypothetical protein
MSGLAEESKSLEEEKMIAWVTQKEGTRQNHHLS